MKAGLKHWIGRMPDLSAVFARFPIPAGLMVIFTFILIFIRDFPAFKDNLGWLCVGLVAAAYMCVNYVLAREAQKKVPLIAVQALLSLILAILAWFSEDLRLLVPLIVGAGILLLGNMAGWGKGRNDLHIWDFTHKIWTGAIFATAGSIIYLLGILAIMAALKSLFGIDIERLMERILMPVGFGFLAPLYWLSTIPSVDEDASELYDNPSFISKAVAFLGTWLLSPLTLIYALILLAYGLKIVLTGELPKGEIAALTTPFLLIGTGTWLVLDPPFVREKTLAKLFRKSWFFLSIPAALLLAVAIGVRIESYGLTWERIALALCVIWSLGLGLWFIFAPKAKRDIRIIPGFAAVLMLIAAFVMMPLSFSNQKSRVVSGLKEAGIMTEAGVIKPLAEITITNEAAARKAKGALQYLQRHKEQKAIERLFAGAENPPEDMGKYSSEIYERTKLDDITLLRDQNKSHENYYSRHAPVDIAGYDLMSGPYWLRKTGKSGNRVEGKGTSITMSLSQTGIDIFHYETTVTTFDIQTWVDETMVTNENHEIQNPRVEIYNEGGRKLALIVRNVSRGEKHSKNEYFNIELTLLSAGFE